MHNSLLYVANWKSNKTIEEAMAWLDEFESMVIATGHTVVITPPFPLLPAVAVRIKGWTNLTVGVQTISPYPSGSYTGAVSVRNLMGLGVTHALVGHSEQRRYFGVTSQQVAQQVDQCLQHQITPIVCIEAADLAQQAQAITLDQLGACVVAYEPVSAIGSGHNESADRVQEVRDRIRTVFGSVPVCYGGSVNAQNVTEYLSIVDGFIVGTASLSAAEFGKLVTTLKPA